MVHGLRSYTAFGVSPDQGSNPRLLHWQACQRAQRCKWESCPGGALCVLWGRAVEKSFSGSLDLRVGLLDEPVAQAVKNLPAVEETQV